MLLALFPLTFVYSTVCMLERTLTCHQVEWPSSFVSIPVRIAKYSFLRWLVVRPESAIWRTILPCHCSLAMSQTSKPLTFISRTGALVIVYLSSFNIKTLYRLISINGLPCLRHCEIFYRLWLILPLFLNIKESSPLHIRFNPVLNQSYLILSALFETRIVYMTIIFLQ